MMNMNGCRIPNGSAMNVKKYKTVTNDLNTSIIYYHDKENESTRNPALDTPLISYSKSDAIVSSST